MIRLSESSQLNGGGSQLNEYRSGLHEIGLTITGPHVRSARALLGWTAEFLAQQAQVGISTVLRVERCRGALHGNVECRKRIEDALHKSGIRFYSDEGGLIAVGLSTCQDKDLDTSDRVPGR